MKNFKKILATSLLLTVALTSFNVRSLKADTTATQEEKSKVLKIKKVLTLPKDGVKIPTKTFKFKFEKQEFNGEKDTSKLTDMPDIKKTGEEIKVDYTETDGKNHGNNYDDDSTTAGKQIIKLTDDILNGVTFTKSGQYTYKVTETEENGTDNEYTCSKAEYLVSLFVEKKGNKFIVTSIQIKQTKDDEGTEKKGDNKKEHNPGTDEDGNKGKDNNFVFNNNYDPKGGNDNPTGKDPSDDDKKGFVLKKEIKGEENSLNKDEEFTFSLTLTKPEGSKSKDTKFNYYVLDSTGNKKDVKQDGANGEKTKGEATYGTDFEVKLKHGERVVFGKVLLGSKIKAEETVTGQYTPGVKENNAKLDNNTVTYDDLKGDTKVIGNNGENFVIVENTKQTAVGFLLNNLPFVVLVGFGIFGLLFFVKNRKDEKKRA